MRKRKIWQLQKCDREYAAGIAADLGVSPVVVSVLLNRGVREKEEITLLFSPFPYSCPEPIAMTEFVCWYAVSAYWLGLIHARIRFSW